MVNGLLCIHSIRADIYSVGNMIIWVRIYEKQAHSLPYNIIHVLALQAPPDSEVPDWHLSTGQRHNHFGRLGRASV